MPDLKTVQFEANGSQYELALSWDDEALMEGEITLELSAAQWPTGEPSRRRETRASLSVQRDEEERAILVVKIGEYTLPPVPLADLYGDTWIEYAIERVPAWAIPVDPITVCLVRSGVSTTIAQVIECKNESEGSAWFRARAKAIGRCLRSNVARMGMKMAFRCGRCIARVGF